MADAVTATKKKYMNFKEIAAYSLGCSDSRPS